MTEDRGQQLDERGQISGWLQQVAATHRSKAAAFARDGKIRETQIHQTAADAWQRAAIGVDHGEYRVHGLPERSEEERQAIQAHPAYDLGYINGIRAMQEREEGLSVYRCSCGYEDSEPSCKNCSGGTMEKLPVCQSCGGSGLKASMYSEVCRDCGGKKDPAVDGV